MDTATGSLMVSPNSATLVDVNSDGKADLIVAGISSGVGAAGIYSGNGDGTFTAPTVIPLSGPPGSLATGHFKNTAHVDIVVATSGTPGNIITFINDGAGNFSAGGARRR